MTDIDYESIRTEITALDWRAELRGVLIFLALVLGPGIATDIAVRAWLALGNEMLVNMAPDHVPHELAILVTQIWLTAGGVVLIGLALWDGMQQWWGRVRGQ